MVLSVLGSGGSGKPPLQPREHPRRVAQFLFGSGKTSFAVRWDQVRGFHKDGIKLSDDSFTPYYGDDGHLLLTNDLLDQQIIDVNGRKVVRVNDIALRVTTNGNEQLWVYEVGVGLQGAFRRLVEGLLPNPHHPQDPGEDDPQTPFPGKRATSLSQIRGVG